MPSSNVCSSTGDPLSFHDPSVSITRKSNVCIASFRIYLVSTVRYLPEVNTSAMPGVDSTAGFPSPSAAPGFCFIMKTSVSYSRTTKSPSVLKKQWVCSRALSSGGILRKFFPLPALLEYGPRSRPRRPPPSSSEPPPRAGLLSTRSSSAMSSRCSVRFPLWRLVISSATSTDAPAASLRS